MSAQVLLAPLDVLAACIIREHTACRGAVSDAVDHAIRCGEALLEAKKLVPHGSWEPWLIEHFPEKSANVPRVYMRLARHKDFIVAQSPAGLTAADELLRFRGGDTRRDPVLEKEVARLKVEGLTNNEIASETGLNKSSVWRLLNPDKTRKLARESARRNAKARRALVLKENAEVARATGGSLADAYALVRRALQEVDRAIGSAEVCVGRERSAANSVISRLHGVEDLLAKLMKGAV